tara:strand:- start:353 stop:751 length:399 start_codon:yes stop_codon:yes gene_type:complete
MGVAFFYPHTKILPILLGMNADDIRSAVDEKWSPEARLLIEKAASTVHEHAEARVERERELIDALDVALKEATTPWYLSLWPSKKRFRALAHACRIGDEAEEGMMAFAEEQGIHVEGTGYPADEEGSPRTAS